MEIGEECSILVLEEGDYYRNKSMCLTMVIQEPSSRTFFKNGSLGDVHMNLLQEGFLKSGFKPDRVLEEGIQAG